MANLIRIRGTQRGAATVYDTTTASGVLGSPGEASVASVRGFRIKSAMGRHFKQNSTSTKATISSGTLTWTANYPGAYGNGIQVDLTTGAYSSVQVVTTTVSGTANPQISVYVPTGLNALSVANAINADYEAGQIISVTPGGGDSNGAAATNSSVVYSFTPKWLSGGSNGTGTQDAEPGPQTQGVAGEPIYVNVTSKTTWVVDADDGVVQRTLQRNYWRFIPLGPA